MTDDLKITWLTLSLIDLLVVETWRREALPSVERSNQPRN